MKSVFVLWPLFTSGESFCFLVFTKVTGKMFRECQQPKQDFQSLHQHQQELERYNLYSLSRPTFPARCNRVSPTPWQSLQIILYLQQERPESSVKASPKSPWTTTKLHHLSHFLPNLKQTQLTLTWESCYTTDVSVTRLTKSVVTRGDFFLFLCLIIVHLSNR